MEYIQWFCAVAFGGIFGWLAGCINGAENERRNASLWINTIDDRMGGKLMEEMKKLMLENEEREWKN